MIVNDHRYNFWAALQSLEGRTVHVVVDADDGGILILCDDTHKVRIDVDINTGNLIALAGEDAR